MNYIVSGTATAGTDFTALSGTVTLPGDFSSDVEVQIPVLNDAVAEPSETSVVTITASASYRIYNDANARVTVFDDDNDDLVMVFSYQTTPSESGTVGKFYLSRTGLTGNLTILTEGSTVTISVTRAEVRKSSVMAGS